MPRLFGLLHEGRPVLLNLTGARCGTRPYARRRWASRPTRARSPRPAGRAWSGVGAAIIRPDGHVWWAADEVGARPGDGGDARPRRARHDVLRLLRWTDAHTDDGTAAPGGLAGRLREGPRAAELGPARDALHPGRRHLGPRDAPPSVTRRISRTGRTTGSAGAGSSAVTAGSSASTALMPAGPRGARGRRVRDRDRLVGRPRRPGGRASRRRRRPRYATRRSRGSASRRLVARYQPANEGSGRVMVKIGMSLHGDVTGTGGAGPTRLHAGPSRVGGAARSNTCLNVRRRVPVMTIAFQGSLLDCP